MIIQLNNPKSLENYRQNLLSWYDKNHRKLPWRQTADPYLIWVSEVMLQQTQVKTVLPYYQRFTKKFPTLSKFANAGEDTILKMWEGLGYYNRVRNFHKAAQIILNQHDNKIPHHWDVFFSLPGVGAYIASAVLSIAHNLPYAAVDGNVKRVLSRLLLLSSPVNDVKYHSIFQDKANQLLDENQPGNYNQALMELGALICKPLSPKCDICPLIQQCKAFVEKKTVSFPKRKIKKAIPTKQIAAGVVLYKDKILITKRNPNGLLGGLWEFPGGKIETGESPQAACLRELKEETGLLTKIESYLTTVKHTYTHFKIEMFVYICTANTLKIQLNGPIDFRWISLEEIEKYPFPGANHKFFPKLKKAMNLKNKT
jgi:A/G-specific adenine glycosylase